MDLILHAPDKTTLLDFAKANGLFVRRGVITDIDPDSPTFGEVIDPGEWVKRDGFDYCWWAGSGQLMSRPRELKATLPVDIVQGTDFGITIPGGTLPVWVDASTTAQIDGEVVGVYDRKQGPYAVFSGTPPAVGTDVEIWQGVEFFPGVVALLRIYGDFFNTDHLDDAVDEEQWSRSKVVRYIKNNGTLSDFSGISYYELDGVKIFRPADVNAMLADRGVPGHEWLGGNSY